jgi:hypothetical protein
MITEALVAGVGYFILVFFKAFQQRNVAFNHYSWILPTSLALAASEVAVMALIALSAVRAEDWMHMIPMVLAVGVGAGAGCLLSMYLHNKIFKENRDES